MKHTHTFRNGWTGLCLVLLFLFTTHLVRAETASTGHDLVSSLNERWNAAFNSGDTETIAGLYDEQAILSPGNGAILSGRESIRELFQGFIDNGVHQHSIEVVDVRREANTLYEVSRWRAYGPESDGIRPVFQGILVNVFHFDGNNEWKSHLHIWNVSE